MVVLVVVAAVVVALLALAWLRRKRPHHEVRMNRAHERAMGQAYLQAQHTRNDIGDPFH
jgi:uncharacterized membrane protein